MRSAIVINARKRTNEDCRTWVFLSELLNTARFHFSSYAVFSNSESLFCPPLKYSAPTGTSNSVTSHRIEQSRMTWTVSLSGPVFRPDRESFIFHRTADG